MTESKFNWAKLAIGTLIFGVMFATDNFVKDISDWLYVIPGSLLGLNAKDMPWGKK